MYAYGYVFITGQFQYKCYLWETGEKGNKRRGAFDLKCNDFVCFLNVEANVLIANSWIKVWNMRLSLLRLSMFFFFQYGKILYKEINCFPKESSFWQNKAKKTKKQKKQGWGHAIKGEMYGHGCLSLWCSIQNISDHPHATKWKRKCIIIIHDFALSAPTPYQANPRGKACKEGPSPTVPPPPQTQPKYCKAASLTTSTQWHLRVAGQVLCTTKTWKIGSTMRKIQ